MFVTFSNELLLCHFCIVYLPSRMNSISVKQGTLTKDTPAVVWAPPQQTPKACGTSTAFDSLSVGKGPDWSTPIGLDALFIKSIASLSSGFLMSKSSDDYGIEIQGFSTSCIRAGLGMITRRLISTSADIHCGRTGL